jgi:N-acetyl-anhydromuramyl-L-alanine amidase AmpD
MNLDQTTLRLPAGEFVDEVCAKDLLVIHHTVGGSAKSTFDYWAKDPRRVGTAYMIDRDGTIYEVFDPTKWAYHVAVKGAGSSLEKRSIGIELASEGGLQESDGEYYSFGVVSPKTRHTTAKVILPEPWRGFTAFDEYEPAQIQSLHDLVTDIMANFPGIPRRVPASVDTMLSSTWKGVCGHHHVRGDKSDPHPLLDWAALAAAAGLTVG